MRREIYVEDEESYVFVEGNNLNFIKNCHHSFTRFASSFTKIKSNNVKPHNPEPP